MFVGGNLMKLMKKIDKKYVINSLITAVGLFALCALVHGLIMKNDYAGMQGQFRTDDDAKNFMGYMITGYLIIAFALNWLYRQGKTAKPYLGQGARFGLAIAAVYNIGHSLIAYTVMPWPWEVVLKEMILATIATVIIGILVAWLNKKG
jgi:hypothetical protein